MILSFYDENEAQVIQALTALSEEFCELNKKDKGEQNEVPAGKSKAIYLENPESAKVPIKALKESEWYKFHNFLGEGNKNLPETLSLVPGSYYGRYLVNVQAEHSRSIYRCG